MSPSRSLTRRAAWRRSVEWSADGGTTRSASDVEVDRGGRDRNRGVGRSVKSGPGASPAYGGAVENEEAKDAPSLRGYRVSMELAR